MVPLVQTEPLVSGPYNSSDPGPYNLEGELSDPRGSESDRQIIVRHHLPSQLKITY